LTLHADRAVDDGATVWQVEAGLGALVRSGRDPALSLRLGWLGGVRVGRRVLLATEVTFWDVPTIPHRMLFDP
jgi:hypothetical protein